MMNKSKKPYILLWLLLAVALVIVVVFAFLDEDTLEKVPLKQGSFKEVLLAPPASADSSALLLAEGADSTALKDNLAETDTTVSSILIIGDSMTILVANRMAAYGKQNGYKVASVTWDSSTSVGWAGADTLERYIERYDPGFIMVTLGSNELFLQNFEARRVHVEKLVKKIGDIPFIWIGPPNWQEDKGFNDMMERALPKGTFFRTEGMELQRGPDHVHPTPAAGIIWTDSIMRWMPKSRHPIRSEVPDSAIGKPAHSSHYIKAK